MVSSQILVNIFEHNTPLHDGAIIMRGDRIVAATCYLPLSGNMTLNKNLGTRHRAAVGMSEVSDALVIAVSEETGNISVAANGIIDTGITSDELRARLGALRMANVEVEKMSIIAKVLKGGQDDKRKDPS